MDARTYIETQIAGFELQRKRRAAAEARQARQAQQRGEQEREGTLDARGWGRLRAGLGSYPTARQVVAVLIAVLLAAALVGQGLAQQASDAAGRGRGGPRHHMVVKPGSAGQQRAARGGTAPQRTALQRKGTPQRVAARHITKVTRVM